MADVVVKLLTDRLANMLAKKITQEVSVAFKYKEDFESIYDELVQIKCLLNDSRARDKSNSELMTHWMNKLQGFLHEALDVVEKYEKAHNSSTGNLIFHWQMGNKIKDLTKKLSVIHISGTKYLDYFKSVLVVNVSVQELNASSTHERRSSAHVVPETHVDMKKDNDVITAKILQEDGPRVIAIVGMGGLGKTHLVQHVFHNDAVIEHFNGGQVWLSVSQKLDVKDLLIQMHNQLHTQVNTTELHSLKESIHAHLQGGKTKKHLFVFDDVWERNILQEIGFSLVGENDKNKILVTTRDKKVSAAMGGAYTHYTHWMDYLSDKDTLELFCIHALVDKCRELPHDLKDLEPAILQKCSRLPLATLEIGKYMADSRTLRNDWEKALKRLNEEKTNMFNNSITPILRSSYDALPSPMKPCFLYFAAFPSDTPVNLECVVYAWIAREFVDTYDGGCSIIEELVDRCVIRVSRFGGDGRIKDCEMQDSFHHLALSEAHKDPTWFFRPGQDSKEFPVDECKGARIISLVKNEISKIQVAIDTPGLRTLLLCDNTYLKSISEGFFNNLKYLSVLDLSKTNIESLPKSIGKLKGLKFLNVSCTNIKKLPKSMSSLRSLQFLNVSRCKKLCRLHSGISEHKSMLYLNANGCIELKSLPSGISKLSLLETLKLKDVVIKSKQTTDAFGWMDFYGLKRLHHLSVTFNRDTILHGFLWKTWIWKEMKEMRALSLQYDDSLDDSHYSSEEVECMESRDILRHCGPLPPGVEFMERLEVLRLSKCRLLTPRLPGMTEDVLRPPEWIFQLRNLTELVLDGDDTSSAYYYEGLQNIPNLRKLRFSNNEKWRSFPVAFGKSGAFPKLEKLIIKDLNSLERFPPLQYKAMPMLKHLRIKRCRMLKRMRDGLDRLPNLQKIELDLRMQESFSTDYPQILNNDSIKISFYG